MSRLIFDAGAVGQISGEFGVIDSAVDRLYGESFDFKHKLVLSIGEKDKTLETVEKICGFLLQNGALRDSSVTAIGGGVVLDTTGFAASIYMRGIKWNCVPTTLLSQADAAVGGKTGVNFGAKNILGSFHMPDNIYFMNDFLYSLDAEQILSGIGEIIKTALLDKKLFDFVFNDFERIKRHDISALAEAAKRCALFKQEICDRDLFDRDLRHCLNVGHTLGHAIEYATGLSHGESVLWGLKIEAFVFRNHIDPDFYKLLNHILNDLLSGRKLMTSTSSILQSVTADKKNISEKIGFIIPVNTEKTIQLYLSSEELKEKLYAYFADK